MHRMALSAIVLSLAASLACGGSNPQPAKTIVLGAVIDQSSSMAWTTWTTAGSLAVDQLNSALQSANSNTRFQFLVSDSAATPTTTVSSATDLVVNKGAKAVITDNSNDDVALVKLAYDADTTNDINVPLMCVTCTSANINNPTATNSDPVTQAAYQDASHWNWRTCTRATQQLTVLTSVVTGRGTAGDVNGDGVFKVSVIVLDDSSGHPYVQSILNKFAAVNPNILVEKITISTSNHDLNDTTFWDTQAALLIDNKTECQQDPNTSTACLGTGEATDVVPDALMENLNPGYNIALSQALARANNSITFFHAHAFRANQVSETLGAEINGQEGVSPVLFETNASGQQFATDLTAASGMGPSLLDASMYDATVALALAALKASVGLSDPSTVTGAQVQQALSQINDPNGTIVRTGTEAFKQAIPLISAGAAINYDGASGPVDFDANGSIFQKLSLYQGQGGAFVDVQKFDCVSSPSCLALP